MSEKDPPEGQPIEPEIVDEGGPEAPRSGGMRRTEQASMAKPAGLVDILSGLIQSPRRDARNAREWADTAHAYTELDEALTGLGQSRQKLRSLPKILAADEHQRDLELARLENQKADEARKAKTAELDDLIAQRERELRLAELEAKLAATKNPQPVDENARRRAMIEAKFREKMGRRYTEQEVRAYAAQLIAEIRKRAGDGPVSESVQREIDNVTDTMNALLNEL